MRLTTLFFPGSWPGAWRVWREKRESAKKWEAHAQRTDEQIEADMEKMSSLERQGEYRTAFRRNDVRLLAAAFRHDVNPASVDVYGQMDAVSYCLSEGNRKEVLQLTLDTEKMDTQKHGTRWLSDALRFDRLAEATMLVAAGARSAPYSYKDYYKTMITTSPMQRATTDCRKDFIELMGYADGVDLEDIKACIPIARGKDFGDIVTLLGDIIEYQQTRQALDAAARADQVDGQVEIMAIDLELMKPEKRRAALQTFLERFPEERAALAGIFAKKSLPSAPDAPKQLAAMPAAAGMAVAVKTDR